MPRNLLFISAYSGLGGGESVQLNLMRALDRAQWTLHLLTPRDGIWPEAARAAGVTTHTIHYRGINTRFVPAIYRSFPISRKIAALLRREDIHAIHSDYHSLPFAVAAGQRCGVPVLWNAMGWWFPARPWQRRFFGQHVTQIIAITQAVRDRWLAASGDFLPPERVPVLVPGVDPDHYRPGAVSGAAVRAQLGIDTGSPLAAMIARFQRVKGHDIFQAMARHVLATLPDAHFAVAGENVFGVSRDERYKREILDAARSDPLLRDRLHYLGFWDDAREVIAAADVMVCPSRFESLGMVHLESMAMGVPVVSMDNGGPAETIADGNTGYLVPPEDPARLADRVLALLRDADQRRAMGAAGRARVLAHYTAGHYAAQVSALLARLIDG